MPHWTPTLDWEGCDVFIIGGGDSLRGFDWNLLKDENTIGCNSAFILGVEICKLCIFGDSKWFKKFEAELAQYQGVVFTNAPQMFDTKVPWVWVLPRAIRGLHRTALGWNENTGASAVNLALILGAQRVFLLGFDMHLSEDGRPNWHNRVMEKSVDGVYKKFLEGFKSVQKCLIKKFPGKEIINVTDNSDLNYFPKVSCKQFWNERKKVSA